MFPKYFKPVLVLCLFLLLTSSAVLAQRPMTDADAAKAATGCFACGGGFLFVIIAVFVINIAILVWVARDAKARGMDSALLWMLLVFFTGLLGLIIYLLSRPQGNVISCPSCNNKRLQASAKCPHCGNP